jgi:spectrin beta
MADYLVRERYNGQDRIRKRADEIMNTWNKLLELLETHKANLGTFSNLMGLLREIDTMSSTIQDLEENFLSNDVGLHLLAVEDLLQKHSLQESQISSMGETLKRLNRQATQYVTAGLRESPMLQERLEKVSEEYAKLSTQSKARRAKLEDARSFFQFVQDHEEEEAWLVEKQRICNSGISAKDLRAVISLQQKHKAVMDEMKARLPKSNKIIEAGHELLTSNPPESNDIKGRIESLQKHWNMLQELAVAKEKKLKEAAEAYHVRNDKYWRCVCIYSIL